MTDGIDEFRVLPENVNSYLEKGFMLMKYCKYCDSYYLPKQKNRIRKCCRKRECVLAYGRSKKINSYVKINIPERKCKSCGKDYKPYHYKQLICGDKKCVSIRNHKYWSERKTEFIKKGVKRTRERYKTDINFRIGLNYRTRLYAALKAKRIPKGSKRALGLIGCEIDYFKRYIANQFEEGMSWDNYGEWHIDHIIPVSHFNLSDDKEAFEAFHYSNCQPLWAKDNMSKGNRFEG